MMHEYNANHVAGIVVYTRFLSYKTGLTCLPGYLLLSYWSNINLPFSDWSNTKWYISAVTHSEICCEMGKPADSQLLFDKIENT